MCESLETTSKVTDDQQEMNNFFQRNKLVESRWLVMHNGGPSMLSEVRFYNYCEQAGTAHHFYPMCSSTTCPGELNPSKLLENSFEACN